MAEPCTLFYFKHHCVGYQCVSWVFCSSLIHLSGSFLIAYTARLDVTGVKCIQSLPGNVTISWQINGALFYHRFKARSECAIEWQYVSALLGLFTCRELSIVEFASVFQTGRPVLTVTDAYSILTTWTGLPRGSDLHPIQWLEQDQSVMSCRDSSLTEGESVVCIVAHMSFVYPKVDILSDGWSLQTEQEVKG
jgi:hypothetical protein